MCTLDDRELQSEGIVESKVKEDTNRPLTARTFVKPLENIVPVRLLNVDPEPKVVYKNAEIGQFQETDAVSFSDSCNLAERHDIEQLYQDSVKHLSKKQAKEVKAFLLRYGSLFAKSNNELGKTNIVKQKEKNDTRDARPIKQAVIPAKERRKVLYFCHDFKGSGHKKTLEKVRSKYYWPGCRKDVRTYVVGCEKCSKRKGPNVTKRALMKVFESGIPMERVATDILRELPKTKRGNRYIYWWYLTILPNGQRALPCPTWKLKLLQKYWLKKSLRNLECLGYFIPIRVGNMKAICSKNVVPYCISRKQGRHLTTLKVMEW